MRRIIVCFVAMSCWMLVLGHGAKVLAHDPQPAPLPADHQPALLKEVRLEPRLGAQLPANAAFHDSDGRAVRLGEYFNGKPSLLMFAYFDCPMLCPLTLDGLLRSLKPVTLTAGSDFNIIVISIEENDSPEAARQKQVQYAGRYGRGDGSGWNFLTGSRQAIAQASEAAGFHFTYDEATGQYAHGAGVFVLTPDGKVARFFYGIDFPPRDLRFGLIEASDYRIGTAVDRVLLYCYHYDPLTGQYGLIIMNALRVTGSATVLALAGFIAVMVKRDRRQAGIGKAEA